MVSSILTNNGALTALQSLKATQKSLLNTQNRISTGLKVATAKDNAATWAVATSMRSDIANTKQVSENLSVSSSIVATAETAAETIADLVKQVRTKVTSAQNPAVDKKQVQADIDGYLAQISSIVDAASFKGVNLINGDGTQNVLTSVNSVNGVSTGAYANIAKQNLKVEDGSMLSDLKNLTVLSRADQTLAKQNDGVQKLEVAIAGGAVDLKAGNKLEVKYIDETGTDRTLTVKVTENITTTKGLVDYLNKDAGFAGKFQADQSIVNGVTANTKIMLSTKDRDSTVRLGSNSGTTAIALTDVLKAVAGDNGVAVTSNVLGTATAAVAGAASVLEMTFGDKPLVMGDEFSIKLDMTPGTVTTDKGDITYKLKVVGGDYKTGDQIFDGSSPVDRVFVIAVAAADVTGANVTGKDIANKLKDALVTGTGATKWNIAAITTPTTLAGGNFLGAAASAGTNYGVEVDTATGTLRLTSADATDSLVGFSSSKTDYDVLLSKLDSATANVANAAASFGTAATRIDLQKDFLDKLVDTLTTGLGALVDADMSEEAARLQALQVQEQLGTQALSIANQAPQSILSLFR
ncbi:flagellin [Roseomonas aerophila]|uniref:Flagellin n=1 Tax=Teichococcus aerophilus TaxID=1224513 RepID=A0ABR7RN45_9PROT|nr:flagellin [Pseudoroseomonas aerophila]MBC9207736.1 flagellin [Pseudoroseomonas aerophila]